MAMVRMKTQSPVAPRATPTPMLLPAFSIEFDPNARPVNVTEDGRQQLYGSMMLTLIDKIGKPRYAVSFSTPHPGHSDFDIATAQLISWALEWMERQKN
jgi:hypothetical protein